MSAAAKTSVTEITLLKASDGDCIFIRCVDDGKSFNLLVDAGRISTVARLKKFIRTLPESERKIDLFVVTHIDADHIAGAIALAKDTELAGMVKALWFNAAKHLPRDTVPMSVGQGKTFVELVEKSPWTWNEAAAGAAIVRKPGADPIKLREDGTLSIHLMGPLPSGLEALAKIWPLPDEPSEPEEPDEERSEISMAVGPAPDVEALAKADYTADDTVPNQSSIAFVLNHGSRRILIGADSHAETLVAAIDEDFDGHLKVDIATLSHHGSRRNTSPELAKRITAGTWTVSTQGGGKHLFPHGESIARILKRKQSGNHPRIAFNSEHRETVIWDRPVAKNSYGYSTIYPDEKAGWITLSIKDKSDPL